MTTACYILDADGEPVPCDNIDEWGRWFDTNDRRVALDDVNGYHVSTVFLGVDHAYGDGPPVLWETMVFAPHDAGTVAQQRYTSRADALRGHAQAVAFTASASEAPHA